jgi:hypothetical protein
MKELQLINLKTTRIVKKYVYKFNIRNIKENIKSFLNNPKIFITKPIPNLVEKEPLYIFIKEKFKYVEGSFIKLSKFKNDYNIWMDKSIFKLNYSILLKVNNNYTIKKIRFCKSCDKRSKTGCCVNYNINNRARVTIIENISYI